MIVLALGENWTLNFFFFISAAFFPQIIHTCVPALDQVSLNLNPNTVLGEKMPQSSIVSEWIAIGSKHLTATNYTAMLPAFGGLLIKCRLWQESPVMWISHVTSLNTAGLWTQEKGAYIKSQPPKWWIATITIGGVLKKWSPLEEHWKSEHCPPPRNVIWKTCY